MAWNVSLGESVECFDLTLLDDGNSSGQTGEKINCPDDSVTFTFLCKNIGSTTKTGEAPETRPDDNTKGIGIVNQTGDRVCKTNTTLANCDSRNMNGNNSSCSNPMPKQTKETLLKSASDPSVNTSNSSSYMANDSAHSQRHSTPQTAVVDLSKTSYPKDRNVKLPERNTNSNQQAVCSARVGTFSSVGGNSNFPVRPLTNQNQQASIIPQPKTSRKDNSGEFPHLTDLILGNQTDVQFNKARVNSNSSNSKGIHHIKPYARPNNPQMQKSNQSSCLFEDSVRPGGSKHISEFRELAAKNRELYQNIYSWEKSKHPGDSHTDSSVNQRLTTVPRSANNIHQSTVNSACKNLSASSVSNQSASSMHNNQSSSVHNNQSASYVRNNPSASSVRNNQLTSSVRNNQLTSSLRNNQLTSSLHNHQSASSNNQTAVNSKVPNRLEKGSNGSKSTSSIAQNKNESIDMDVLFHTLTKEPSKAIFQQEYKAQKLIEKLQGSFLDGGNTLAEKYVSKAFHLEKQRYYALLVSSPANRRVCNSFYDKNLLRLLYHLEQNLRQLLQEQYNKQTYTAQNGMPQSNSSERRSM